MADYDAFGVFAGLLNIESTLLRFDINDNNILDGTKRYSEVLNAYEEVYQGAIKGLVAKNGGFLEKLAKPIFMYLVKYGKIPDTGNMDSLAHFAKYYVKFLARSKKAHEHADRSTMATILKTLKSESETNKVHPFQCEKCFRNPDQPCEPEGDW